jgi:drug/metabolite transporter (DMT)-like permease
MRAGFFALAAAVLYGASFPLAKAILDEGGVSPFLLAGAFYLSQSLLFGAIRIVRPAAPERRLTRADLPSLAGAILFGGVVAPGLFFHGQVLAQAHVAALLAPTEIVFTSAIAYVMLRERLQPRELVAFAFIVAGGVTLGLGGGNSGPSASSVWGVALVTAAFLMWGFDNNFTTRISHRDPLQISMVKGLFGGAANVGFGLMTKGSFPLDPGSIAAIAGVGMVCYGVSLTLFIYSMREIGASRSTALFGTNPAFGVALAVVLLAESPTAWGLVGGAIVVAGVALLMLRRRSWRKEGQPPCLTPGSRPAPS